MSNSLADLSYDEESIRIAVAYIVASINLQKDIEAYGYANYATVNAERALRLAEKRLRKRLNAINKRRRLDKASSLGATT